MFSGGLPVERVIAIDGWSWISMTSKPGRYWKVELEGVPTFQDPGTPLVGLAGTHQLNRGG